MLEEKSKLILPRVVIFEYLVTLAASAHSNYWKTYSVNIMYETNHKKDTNLRYYSPGNIEPL